MNWAGKGLLINREWLSNLRYADDIVLIAKNTSELEFMANELITECKKARLNINTRKTKILDMGSGQNIVIQGEEIKEVREIEYLG